jgi:hypothetical protein
VKSQHILQMSAMEDTIKVLSPGDTWISMTTDFRQATQSEIQRSAEKLRAAELLVVERDEQISLLQKMATARADLSQLVIFKPPISFTNGFPAELATDRLCMSEDPPAHPL